MVVEVNSTISCNAVLDDLIQASTVILVEGWDPVAIILSSTPSKLRAFPGFWNVVVTVW